MLRPRRVHRLLAVVASAVAVAASADEQTLDANIVGTDSGYENINTDATDAQLHALGIELGSRFTFEHKGKRYFATLVADYSDVQKGEWLGLLDGKNLELAISFGQGCPAIACAKGDRIVIMKASKTGRE